MTNMNIDWHLVNQMKNSLERDHGISFGREQMYKMLIKSNMINKDGTPTKMAINNGLVDVESMNIEAIKDDNEYLNPNVSYKQMLSSFIETITHNLLKNHKDKTTKDQKIIVNAEETRVSLLYKKPSEFKLNQWKLLIFLSYQFYYDLKQCNLALTDVKKLKNHFKKFCHEFINSVKDKDVALDIISESIKAVKQNTYK